MRQSAAEIDHAILDVAAAIFATHGFAHASVQQIADAVGYSKPGLLHRFGSKVALHRAVLDEVSRSVQEIIDHAEARSGRPNQVNELLELVTRRALARPGMAQVLLRAFEPGCGEPGSEAFVSSGHRLLAALEHPPSTPVERLRVVLAARLVVNAATTQRSPVDAELHVDTEELVPLLVALAAHLIGVHGDAAG